MHLNLTALSAKIFRQHRRKIHHSFSCSTPLSAADLFASENCKLSGIEGLAAIDKALPNHSTQSPEAKHSREFPASIAAEIADEVNALFGSAGFKAIVPMPCGHSRGDSCLSLEIARALGLITGLPVIQAFLSEPVKGVSHPKENLKRPPLKLARVINEPVLLVDDVATSVPT